MSTRQTFSQAAFPSRLPPLASSDSPLFVTTLTENRYSVEFISNYGSDAYFRHNKGLLLYEREQDLAKEIEELGE